MPRKIEMSITDYAIVLVPLLVLLAIAGLTKRYVKSVADFLSAGRVAGRYLLAVSDGTAGTGLVLVIAAFEMYYQSGWAINFWASFGVLVTLMMTLTGFVAYRYRETRVMTMSQLFELRYSKSFRIFAGLVAFLCGVINYAIFPAVGGRFLIYYCGWPLEFTLFGISLSTFGTVMALFLGLALLIVLFGGQLTTMVTDCVQGIFCYIGFTVLAAVIFYLFSFDQFETAMLSRGPGESFINPYDTAKLTEFNVLYVLIGLFSLVYYRMSWQGNQGYNCAGASPHEQKMGGVLGAWRGGFLGLVVLLLAIGAYTYMNNPEFASGAAAVQQELTDRIQFPDQAVTNTIRQQMLVPVVLRHLLPVGISGTFCALMIFLMLSTDTTYLHSWGSIFIQDVVLPFRRKPFKPETQLRLLRLSITGVAIFAWFFSFYFSQVTFLIMFFALSGAFYTGASGAVIIGGLYWRRGSTSGAWAAMICSVVTGGLIFWTQTCWHSSIYPFLNENYPDLLARGGEILQTISRTLPIVNWEITPERFPVTAVEMSMIGVILCIVCYVAGSLISNRKFDLAAMLHRPPEAEKSWPAVCKECIVDWRERLLGITAEYSRGDRILAWSVILWTLYNFAVFMLQLVWNSCFGVWSSETWFAWWKYYNVPLGFLVAIVTSIWFTIGGTRDLVRLFRNLKNRPEDASDDGRVIATTTGMEREADHTANDAPKPETAWPANQTAKEIDL